MWLVKNLFTTVSVTANRAMQIGTAPLQSPHRERAVSTNQLAILALALSLAFEFYYLFVDFNTMRPVILVNAVAIVFYLLALYSNSRGNTLSATCITLATPLFFQIPAVCYLVSADSGIHLYLLAGGAFALLLLSDDQKYLRLAVIAISLTLYIVIERYCSRELAIIKLPDPFLNFMIYFNAVTTSLLIYVLASHSHKMITKQGERIEAQSIKLKTLANTDPLTQLPNRRQILSAIKTTDSNKNPFTGVLAVADIDHFKSFNDRFGHDCGDEILRSLAYNMSNSMRAADTVGRWGGEEFIFLLSGLNMTEARPILERLRLSIEKTPITYSGAEHYITVSIGAAEMADENSFKAAFKVADQALYQCKQNGRNCVTSI